MTWDEPYDGGSPITGYKVLFSQNQIVMPSDASQSIPLQDASISNAWPGGNENQNFGFDYGPAQALVDNQVATHGSVFTKGEWW